MIDAISMRDPRKLGRNPGDARVLFVRQPQVDRQTQLGIRMKLSIDNCCKFNGFMLLSQTRAEYLCCCASLSRRLGHQMFCGGTGTGEKAAECQLGLKNRLHPPIGQRLEMS